MLGAGSGIGKAKAILFAKEGASVIIVDRKEEWARITYDECNNFGGSQVDYSNISVTFLMFQLLSELDVGGRFV